MEWGNISDALQRKGNCNIQSLQQGSCLRSDVDARKASPTIPSPTIPTMHAKEFARARKITYRYFPLSSQVCKDPVTPNHS